MATIDFPFPATTGQQYTFGSRTWQFDGNGWPRLINQGQVSSVFVPLGPVLIQLSIVTLPSYPQAPWSSITHL